MPPSLRPFRLMCSPPSSPRRVFSESKSSLLNALALDNSLSSSDDGTINVAHDPFSQQLSVSVDKATDHDASCHLTIISSSSKMKRKQAQSQWPPLRLKRGSVVFEEESTDSVAAQPLKRSTTGSSSSAAPTFVRATSIQLAAQPQPKLVSKASKENSVVNRPSPQLVFDPPLAHPLPTYSYREYRPTPRRVYVRREADADERVDILSGPVGFDLEWKVVFSKGSAQRPAAIVQLSDRNTILITQVSAMKRFPRKLKDLLENPKIAKIGVNILNDGNKLARDYGVYSQGLVELSKLARQADIHFQERYAYASDVVTREKVNSAATSTADAPKKKRKPGALVPLSMATAMYTGRELPKGGWVRCGNWEAQPLNEMQLEYAANDAHSALMIYYRLLDLAETTNIVLEPKKYSSDVKPDNNNAPPVETDTAPSTPLKLSPYEAAPLCQAPAIAEQASSSSSAASTVGYEASSSSYATTSTATSDSLHLKPSQDSSFEPAMPPTLQATMKVPVSHTDVSDDDIQVFEVRVRKDSSKVKQTATNKPSLKGPFESSGMSSSERWQAEIRGRSGPRFKPSYDTLLSTRNASRSPSPSKSEILEKLVARTTEPASESASTSKSPSRERSPRFKPSYDTTLSRSSSPSKAATLPIVSESKRPRTPAATPIAWSASSSSAQALSPSARPFSSSFSSKEPTQPQPAYRSPQHIRAYNLWYHRQFSLPDICSTLRSKDDPLKTSTVITYVVSAVQTDPRLHFSRSRLKELLTSEQTSWYYYRDWFHTLNVHKYVNMDVGTGDR